MMKGGGDTIQRRRKPVVGCSKGRWTAHTYEGGDEIPTTKLDKPARWPAGRQKRIEMGGPAQQHSAVFEEEEIALRGLGKNLH